jgi:lipocalin
MWCGVGVAGADTGSDAGPASRGTQASSAAADSGAKPTRTSPARVQSAKASAAASSAGTAAPRNRTLPTAAVDRAVPAPAAARVVANQGSNSPAAPAASTALTTPKPAAAVAAASTKVAPSSVPIDAADYAGTYYEQGSVKQFFSIGLVNTKATYTVKSDGTLGVKNSGNYFFNRGPKSSIVGSAVPVNPINTALNVGFFGAKPSANPPGNYLIIDRAPDYSWAIVSDPSGRSGYILTRDQTIDPQKYQELVARAQSLGVTGRITTTRQFPA